MNRFANLMHSSAAGRLPVSPGAAVAVPTVAAISAEVVRFDAHSEAIVDSGWGR